MKKILAISLLCLASVPAMAQHRHHGGYHRHYNHGGGHWVAPLILGGVVGYAITRNNEPVIVQQPPVIVQQPMVTSPVPPGANCSPWVETQQADGSIVRQRTCTQ